MLSGICVVNYVGIRIDGSVGCRQYRDSGEAESLKRGYHTLSPDLRRHCGGGDAWRLATSAPVRVRRATAMPATAPSAALVARDLDSLFPVAILLMRDAGKGGMYLVLRSKKNYHTLSSDIY